MSQGVAFWAIDLRWRDCLRILLWLSNVCSVSICYQDMLCCATSIPILLITYCLLFFVSFMAVLSSSSTWPLPQQVNPFLSDLFVCLSKSVLLSQDSTLCPAGLLIKQLALSFAPAFHTQVQSPKPCRQTLSHMHLESQVTHTHKHTECVDLLRCCWFT